MWGFGRQSWRSTRVLSCTWWQHMAASWYATTYALALVLSQLDKPKFLHECSMISGIICEVAYIRCPHHDQSKVESLGTQQTWTSQKVKRPFGEKTMHMLCGINVWLLQTPWGEVLSTNCDYYGNRLLINDYLKNILWKLRVYIYIYIYLFINYRYTRTIDICIHVCSSPIIYGMTAHVPQSLHQVCESGFWLSAGMIQSGPEGELGRIQAPPVSSVSPGWKWQLFIFDL